MSDLISIASADGSSRDEEYDFLHKIAARLELEPMEIEGLFTSTAKHPAPQLEEDRIELFIAMLEMVASDQEIVSDELLVLRDMSLKLGLRLQAVDQSIKALEMFENGKVPTEVIRSFFALHLN